MPEPIEEYVKEKGWNLTNPKDNFEAYQQAGKLASEYWWKNLAETYLHDFPEQHQRIDWIISMLYGSVLDVGCGEGVITNFTVAQPFVNRQMIVGVEPSVDLLKFGAHWKTPSHFIQSMGENLPFKDGVFDCVVAAELFEHVINPDVVMEECKRVLKSMGLLVVTTPLDEEKWLVNAPLPNPLHLRRYNEEQMMEFMSSHRFKTITVKSGKIGEPFKYTHHTQDGWKEKLVQTRMTFIYATGVKLQ